MSRRPKTGLSYFPKDVGYYDDFKMMDLLNDYGPLGQTIYDIILTQIYREGYYLEVPLDKLAAKVVRIIGNRWVKDKSLVLQVIQYCADIGLFNKELLAQSVITSVGIQRRYSEVTVRNKVNKERYWLIDETGQPLLNAPIIPISVTEMPITETEMPITETNNQQKESKQKESKENIYNELFQRLWTMYPEKKGIAEVSKKSKEDIYRIGEAEMTRAIQRYMAEWEKDKEWKNHKYGSTFFNSGYKDYLDANYVPSTNTSPKKNAFHNFEPRSDLDFKEFNAAAVAELLKDARKAVGQEEGG